jgi:Protein of unknown function (DUF3072)
MTDSDAVNGAIKDPDDWVTGDEPWTAAQHSYIATLSREAGQDAPESLTKAQAAKLIEELQERTGRGQ